MHWNTKHYGIANNLKTITIILESIDFRVPNPLFYRHFNTTINGQLENMNVSDHSARLYREFIDGWRKNGFITEVYISDVETRIVTNFQINEQADISALKRQ